MEKQFVTYDIALKLKELGFDELCFGTFFQGKFVSDNVNQYVWNLVHSKRTNSDCNSIDIVMAPLWQQAIDWLWNQHSILIYPYLVPDKTKTIMWVTKQQHEDFWSTQEQAILKALELINKE